MNFAQRKVLVLNRGWSPIAVFSLERSMGLISGEYKRGEPKARIVDTLQDFRCWAWDGPKDDPSVVYWKDLVPAEGEPVIRSAKAAHRIPEVILLSRFNKLPTQRLHFSRRTVYRRDNNTCQYCGRKPGTAELTIDHIVPRSKGGLTTWENCCLACVTCNKRKADRTPEQACMKLLRKPFKPKYTLFRGDYRCKSWEAILGVAYWEVELQHDMITDEITLECEQ